MAGRADAVSGVGGTSSGAGLSRAGQPLRPALTRVVVLGSCLKMFLDSIGQRRNVPIVWVSNRTFVSTQSTGNVSLCQSPSSGLKLSSVRCYLRRCFSRNLGRAGAPHIAPGMA